MERYRKTISADESLLGLAAVIESDDGTYIKNVSIFEEFIERREHLMQKNRFFDALAYRYVSNVALKTGENVSP